MLYSLTGLPLWLKHTKQLTNPFRKAFIWLRDQNGVICYMWDKRWHFKVANACGLLPPHSTVLHQRPADTSRAAFIGLRAGATTRPELVVSNLKCHRFSPPVRAWCELWKWLESLSFREMVCYWDYHVVNFPFLSMCERRPTMSAHAEYCDICDWWWCVQEEACYGWHISSPLISPQGPPKPVAVEPCSGGKAAVLTVLLCLPRGASGVPPPGQSGQ